MPEMDSSSHPIPNVQSVRLLESLVVQSDKETFTEQQKNLLSTFRYRANLEIERIICSFRILLVVILLPSILLSDSRLLTSFWQLGVIVTTCTIIIGFSWWMIRILKTNRPLGFLLWISVILEPLMVALLLLPSIIAPLDPNTYHGFLRYYICVPLLMLGILLTSARGFRKLAWTGIVLYLATFLGLILTDHIIWPASPLDYSVREVIVTFIILICCGLMGRFSAADTERQAVQSSQIMLVAERVHDRFRSYVPNGVADKAVLQPQLRLGGDRTQVAVLFSDLRGFTHYAENNEPENLVAELNEYLDAMVSAVNSEGGIVDKFLGDSLMAVFGLGRSTTSAPARAIRAALVMNQRLAELNKLRASRGLLPFQHGIGVDYGSVVAGNIGSTERMEYTVIGEPVNLASRIQVATKKLGHSLLVSENALMCAKNRPDIVLPPMIEVDSITVKGSSRIIKVYTIAGSSRN